MTQAGRRPGATETREAIVEAARSQFAAKGYEGATIRSIAAEAEVNPALVHHFFGTKEELFASVLDFPLRPAEVLGTLTEGPREEAGERLVRIFLAVWADPTARASLLAVLRSAMTNEQAATMLRQFVEAALLARIAGALQIPRERVIAAAAQMVGLTMARYVVRLEPIASAAEEEIVGLVAPVIQAYIDGGW